MASKLEDFAGKSLSIVAWTAMAVSAMFAIRAAIGSRANDPLWPLMLASTAFALVFLALIIFYTVVRLPPKDSAAGIEPRLTAIAGTFLTVCIVGAPVHPLLPGARIVSTALIAVGTLSSIYCMAWLGRSFSIMATARALVTGGPYSVVRHPLYLAEATTVAGIVLSKWSMPAVMIGGLQLALQVRRMFNEERVLRATFADYATYADRVPMLLPASRWLRLGLGNARAAPLGDHPSTRPINAGRLN
jgi:protein-S-isoprenylcysteine O-methyltransferase Ste14